MKAPAAATATAAALARTDEDPALAGLGAETITLAEAMANGAPLAPTDTPRESTPWRH